MNWAKLTLKGGQVIYVNLENANTVAWNDHDKGTIIVFPGGPEDVVMVQETPEMALSGR
jgi:hypothetical protein